MKYYIVDAFTQITFGGNPAGVVILDPGKDFPPEETMLKTAAELRYSETAFVKKTSEDTFNIRYFTPAAEVNLCGHATIGAFAALLDAGLVSDNCSYTNETLAGKLKIEIKNGFVMMEMAAPQHLATIESAEALSELYSIMGLSYESVRTDNAMQRSDLLPMIISAGLPDIIMPVDTKASLSKITPDFPALTDLSKKYDVVGVHAFTLDAEEAEIMAHCRNFAPLYDIDEEAATGTSNGALAYYLLINGLLSYDKDAAFMQGESMGRPSVILSRISKGGEDDSIEIQVGGSAVVLAEGQIFI